MILMVSFLDVPIRIVAASITKLLKGQMLPREGRVHQIAVTIPLLSVVHGEPWTWHDWGLQWGYIYR